MYRKQNPVSQDILKMFAGDSIWEIFERLTKGPT
jgi:hypothetical protein